MKISTRGRYGLRTMLKLARSSGEPPVPVGTLAGDEGISRKYLYALLRELKSAGLVRSVRGVGGGFVLARVSAFALKPPSILKQAILLRGSLPFSGAIREMPVIPKKDNNRILRSREGLRKVVPAQNMRAHLPPVGAMLVLFFSH